MYKITDLEALKAKFPHFVKMKTKKVTTTQEVAVLDQAKVKWALKAGIEVPGVSNEAGA